MVSGIGQRTFGEGAVCSTRGLIRVESLERGDASKRTAQQKRSINIVVWHHGKKTPPWLSELTRLEDPWKHPRAGMPNEQRGDTDTPKQDMAECLDAWPKLVATGGKYWLGATQDLARKPIPSGLCTSVSTKHAHRKLPRCRFETRQLIGIF